MDPTDDELNAWAAEFLGDEDPGSAVKTEWYTTQPGAAFAVLRTAAEKGTSVKLEIANKKVEAEVGEGEAEGEITDLARVITLACYLSTKPETAKQLDLFEDAAEGEDD